MAGRLEDVLRECTVRVVGGPMMGAGFFAAPGIVVTCAHVAGPGGDLRVHWERDGELARTATVTPRITRLASRGRPIPALEEDYPDIAVLEIEGFDKHPCVKFDAGWPSEQDTFLVFGYPREGGAIRLTPARLSYRGMNGTLPTIYLDLASDTIKPGMSGAAVLNLRTGGVCGVVVASKNATRPDGALAVPWAAVAGDLGELRAANHAFHLTDRRWLTAHRDSRADEGPSARVVQHGRLRSYLTAAQAAASQHPYTIGIAGAPALSTVYLSQKLAAQADQSASPQAVDPNTGITADRIRQALHRFDISGVLERNQGALVVGAPGSGKSSLLRHLITAFADKWAGAEQHDFIPVLVHARSLLGPLPINQAIAGALRKDLGARLDDVDLDALFADPPLPGVPWLVLLDGLDEIFEADNRQQVMDIVKRWWDDPRYRFLLTSRPLPERELHVLQVAKIPIFEIQAFSEDQLPLLSRRWLHALGVPDAEEVAGLFVAQVRQARMAQLARNPLIATIACVVFASNPDHGLSYGRADLYEAFIALFLEKIFADGHFLGSIKERIGRYDPQAITAVDTLVRELRSLIQDLAALRFAGSAPSLRTATEQLAARYHPRAVPLNSWNHVAAELLVQSGLISAQADDLVFNHETIIEYLAACARAQSSRLGRLGVRERWQLMTSAGSNESYALFVVALLRQRGLDLTDRPPTVLQARQLLHARLVAAMVHDGYELKPDVVAAATRCLSTIATMKTSGIPYPLRRGIWQEDDDCVIAAKALTLIDKDRGLDLLFTLAADPTVPTFSVFDVLAEVMVMEDLIEIDSARGISVLYRFVSAPSATASVDQMADSYNRMLIANLILERNPELGEALLKTLAGDKSMDLDDRMNCIERLIDIDRTVAIQALTGIITDISIGQRTMLDTYRYLRDLDRPAAAAALTQVAIDKTRTAHARAAAGIALHRDDRAEGARVFREMSSDLAVLCFYRVYHFAEFEEQGDRASRLLTLSRDTTLPGIWRVFAAEELLRRERDDGIEALRAIQRDETVGRRLRVKLLISLYAYDRLATSRSFLAELGRTAARMLKTGTPAYDVRSVPAWVPTVLLPYERVLSEQRFHSAALLKPFALLFCCLLAAGTLSAVFPQGLALAVIWATWGVLLLHFGMDVVEWRNKYIIVTDKRLLVNSGAVRKTITMMPPNAITDMYFERPILGCALGYGSFSTTSPGMPRGMYIEYVPYPEQLYADMVSIALPKESGPHTDGLQA